jgi:hypothetical protein
MSELVPRRVEEGSLVDPNLGRCQALCKDCAFEAEDLRCVFDAKPGHLLHFHSLANPTTPTGAKHVFAVKEVSPKLHTLYINQPIVVPPTK